MPHFYSNPTKQRIIPKTRVVFSIYWIRYLYPNNQTLMASPMTILCICAFFENLIPFLTRRLHHVRNDKCFRSIFCVFFLETTSTCLFKQICFFAESNQCLIRPRQLAALRRMQFLLSVLIESFLIRPGGRE